MKRLFPELSEQLESCFRQVYKSLGYGFLEKLYEKALRLELERRGLAYSLKPKLDVFYEGVAIGHFFPDLLVQDMVIVEIKSIEALRSVHEVQTVNYLAATRLEVAYLVNFGPQLEVLRKVFTNDQKLFANDQVSVLRRPAAAGSTG